MSEPIILTCLSCGQVNRVPLTRLNAGPECARCKALLVDGDVAEIVDYWAPWCGLCRMMAPEFAKAAAALRRQARFAKINTEQFPQVSSRLNIRGIPLLILYAGGHEADRLSGARPAADIENFVRSRL